MRDHEPFLRTLREEGAAEVERVKAEARLRAEETIATAESESRAARVRAVETARRDGRLESARRRAERAAIASRELLVLRRETIESALGRAGELLESTDPGREGTRRLAREVVGHLPSGSVRLRCRPGAVEIVKEVLRERPDLEAVVEAEADLDGVVAATGEGDLLVEGTLSALLDIRRRELAVFLAREIEEPSP